MGAFTVDVDKEVSSVFQAIRDQNTSSLDAESRALFVPAPNAIRWIADSQYLNQPIALRYTRSYEVIRDFFELLCPFCNSVSAKNCWGKTVSELLGQTLLEWDASIQDDRCPRCRVTRNELIDDRIFQGFNQFNLIAGMRCLDADSTFVFTDDGLLSLREVSTGVNVVDRASTRRITAKHGVEKKSAKKVRLSRGFSLTGSDDHRVLVVDDELNESWTRIADLRAGDSVKVSFNSGLFGTQTMPLAAARVLGGLVANGDVTDKYRARFDHGSDEACLDFIRDVASLGIDCSWKFTSSRERDRRSGLVEVSGIEFVEWLRKNGLHAWTSCDKEVPFSIRAGTAEVVAAFLGAYIDCDGSVSDMDNPAEQDVTFCTVSEKLSAQIRLLFLNLGILTNTSECPTRSFSSKVDFTGTTTYFSAIAKTSILRFADVIKLRVPHKRDALAQMVSYYTNNSAIERQYGPSLSAKWLLGVAKRAAPRKIRSALGVKAADALSAAASQDTPLSKDLAAAALRSLFGALNRQTREKLSNYADERYTFLRVISVEDVGERDMADLTVEDTSSYAANGVVTHNSGKSYSCAYMATYVEHRLLVEAHNHPRGLAGYYDLSDGTQFEGTFIAASQTQSEGTVWANFINLRRTSPWMRRYTEWVRREEKSQVRSGMRKWEYEETLTFIRNEHPRVRWEIRALNSNSNTAAGRTRVFSFVDELARMHHTDSAQGVDEIYRTQESSLHTVRSRAAVNGCVPWSGPIFSVTSTKTRKDYALLMHKRCEAGLVPRMFSRLHPTVDFNPNERIESFADVLKKDPVGTKRDFWCEPPGAEYPLITDERRFRTLAVDQESKPTARFRPTLFTAPTGHGYIRLDVDRMELKFEYPRYLVFDAGLNFDAFTGVCAYGEPDGEGRTITRYDWVFRIVPPKGSEVFFDCVLDIVEEAARAMRVISVEFDHWNSKHLIQTIRNKFGIMAEERALDSDDFRAFANDSLTGLVRLISPEEDEYNPDRETFEWLKDFDLMSPHGAAIREITELQCDPDTLKVYNPEKGRRRGFHSDDAARVVVHAHKLVQSAGYIRKPGSRNRDDARKMAQEGETMFEPGLVGGSIAGRGPLRNGSLSVDAGSVGSLSKGRGGGRGW